MTEESTTGEFITLPKQMICVTASTENIEKKRRLVPPEKVEIFSSLYYRFCSKINFFYIKKKQANTPQYTPLHKHFHHHTTSATKKKPLVKRSFLDDYLLFTVWILKYIFLFTEIYYHPDS